MILRSHLSLSILLGQALQLVSPVVAKKDQPRITQYEFTTPPTPGPPLYFEDSNSLLILDTAGNVLLSDDAGEKWGRVDDIKEGSAVDIVLHPEDTKTAYVLGRESTHWVTEDRGKTWRDFELEGRVVPFRPPISFHAADNQRAIIHVCSNAFACEEMAYITTDAFKSPAKELRRDTRGCVFARSTPLFSEDADETIVCAVKGRYALPWATKDNRLVVSDDYFENEEEPVLETDRTVQGIVNVAVVKGFLVAAASAKGTDELALYVTNDAKIWHRAVFPQDHKLEQDAYTVLESTNYSIQIDVMTTNPLNAVGVLFTSNSNGTYFTRNIEHTNRNIMGLVDFEKIAGIQGIFAVNIVDNAEKVKESPLTKKKIKSKITFDDGRTFSPLKADDDEIHLHSVSDMSNSGRVFSSPAPGLVMGIGNKGEFLKGYEEGDLYVSDDAGVTWRKALKEAHKYEFGDRGAVLVAIYDEGPTDEIQYSLDHGKTWEKADLGDKIRARILTTTQDSTSLKFLLLASKGGGSDLQHYAFSIDFEDLHEGKCKDEDFEDWNARVDEDGKPSCIMGHKQWYRRRKPASICFVEKEFEDPVPQSKKCPCQKQDFECDYNFVLSEDGDKCEAAGVMPVPKGQCENSEGSYMGSSGFRLIPGNDCDREHEDAVELDVDVERPCKESVKPIVSGKISIEKTEFRAGGFQEYFYLERTDSSTGEDETIVMRTDRREVYITQDAGKTWDQILKDEEVTAIYPHQYFNDVVFFLTGGKKVFYSINRGKTTESFTAPEEPTRKNLQILSFHPQYKDWLIWTGGVDCDSKSKGECHNVAFFSEDRGATWDHRLRYVHKCEFIKEAGQGGVEKLVYCEQYRDERLSEPLQLKWSDNWFADDHKPFDDIIDFATMSEFIVVAARQEDDRESLSCHTSVDGKTFAHAQFPPTFEFPAQKAYTVLDSSTHAVFLHVTVNNREDSEYGSIIKSNSNGTSYVMSLNGVNRNGRGYVDFEKMLGLEGVILVNIVANMEEADEGKYKKLRTMITHNDGAQWAWLKAPPKDAEDHKYDCDTSDVSKCSLHLHSYTERKDPRSTFSSPSAIGLMMAVGNVGEYLSPKAEADTFLTRDGGIEWIPVKKGNYIWEYGDQGSIIVIVEADVATQSLFYTRNEGRDWLEFEFSETPFQVKSLSTVPSDKSRNFILWGQYAKSGDKISTINIDFTGLTDRKCELDEQDPEAGDYYLWEPKHPVQKDNCLFGHISQYHRKKLEAECYNGRTINHGSEPHNISRNCDCTREDFECDYNYEIQKDGSCSLVPGLDPPDHSQACRDNPDLVSYWKPTGYRRTPLDTCEGGQELEYQSNEVECEGHKGEFDDKQRSKGLSGFWFFVLVVLLPVGIASAVGYWVWQNWDGKFGRIRLGEPGSAFDADRPWIAWPIAAVSGIVAVIATLPMVVGSIWRRVSGLGRGRRYTSRSDFARGGRYAVVDPDEDELLGDDLDEDGV